MHALFVFIISTVISISMFSQNNSRYEISVAVLAPNKETINIIPCGSSDFISKVITDYKGDTLIIKVIRRSNLSLILFRNIPNLFYSTERKENIKGIIRLKKQINYIKIDDKIWRRYITKEKIKLISVSKKTPIF